MTWVFSGCLAAFVLHNVAPFSPGDEAALAKQLVEYRDRTGGDSVLYSLTLHPEGRPAWKKVERCLASYRCLKKELEGSGVKLGVLVQAILGHWPRVGAEDEPWTRSITLEGKEKRMCPEDPRYRQYIADVFTAIARERPAFVMLDDDVHANGYFGIECFCERHTAKFNRENGTSYSPESFRAAVAASRPGDETCRAFRKLQETFVKDVVRLARSSIDAVDPTIEMATCGGGLEERFNHEYARLAAAKGQLPVMRIDNGHYNRRSLAGLAGNIAHTQASVDYNRDIPALLDESDTFPHHRWSTTASFLDLKLQAGAFCGLKGAKLWFVNTSKCGWPVSRAYTDILSRHRRLYPEIVEALGTSVPEGVIVPSLAARQTWGVKASGAFTDGQSWIAGMMGNLGIPFVCRSDLESEGVYALAGERSARELSEADLRHLFSHRVLVDSAAAIELTSRGFADLMGVRAETGKNLQYNVECDVRAAVQYPFTQSDKTPLLTPLAANAETVTTLSFAPFFGAKETMPVAPGSVMATNSLGGRVIVTAYCAMGTSMFDPPMSEARKAWLLGHLKRLGWQGVTVRNDQDVILLARRFENGERLLGVFNTGFDPLGEIVIEGAGAKPSVSLLTEEGTWRELHVSRLDDGAIVLPVSLPCSNAAILRLK